MSLAKRLLGGLLGRPRADLTPRVAFIFACQRSGTTALLDFLMGAGPPLKAFTECDSPLTDRTPPEGGLTVRLNPLENVERVLAATPEPVRVVKPLVESQRALELLGRFPGSCAFWLYRDVREVAASMLKKWGPPAGAPHLAQVLEGETGNWRGEDVPAHVLATLKLHYAPDMADADAAALFWWARNELFFAQGLERDARVLLLDFERMCSVPDYVDRALDHFRLPHPSALGHFRPEFSGKARELPLDREVERLCRDLHGRLEAARFL
ncbi:MAG TPA: hypothetical protein VMT18_12640 [Planctomycetota bacterium]|nr:hypothetical protein [Planctomycetota bacterium]